LVTAGQCFHRAQACPAPPTAPPASGLGVPVGLGGGTARTADPDRQKGCPTPHGVTLSSKDGGKFGRGVTVRGLAGHRSVDGEQLFLFASLVFLGFYFPLSLLLFFPLFSLHFFHYCYLFVIIKLFLSQPMSFILTFTLPVLPHPTGGKGSE